MRANKSKKDRIRLDGLREEGRLKNGGPDIADIWAITNKKKKSAKPKFDYSKLFEQYKKTALVITKKVARKAEELYKYASKRSKLVQKIPLHKIPIRKIPYQNKKFRLISGAFVGVFVVAVFIASRNDSPQYKATLGATDSASAGVGAPREDENAIARDEVEFKPLLPEGKDESALTIATRKSPAGDVIYTFEDQSDEQEIQVTEQKMPESFKGQEAMQIEKMAKDLQATNVIQIDENKVFHGISEETGVQTLITSKKDLLIFIRSNVKQPDEFWLNYYLQLK